MMEGLKIPEGGTRPFDSSSTSRTAFHTIASDTLVDIDLFSGRSFGAKKTLYQAIVRNLEPFGIPPDQVKILLRESPAENWGIRGGVPASEVELGFEVNV